MVISHSYVNLYQRVRETVIVEMGVPQNGWFVMENLSKMDDN